MSSHGCVLITYDSSSLCQEMLSGIPTQRGKASGPRAGFTHATRHPRTFAILVKVDEDEVVIHLRLLLDVPFELCKHLRQRPRLDLVRARRCTRLVASPDARPPWGTYRYSPHGIYDTVPRELVQEIVVQLPAFDLDRVYGLSGSTIDQPEGVSHTVKTELHLASADSMRIPLDCVITSKKTPRTESLEVQKIELGILLDHLWLHVSKRRSHVKRRFVDSAGIRVRRPSMLR